MSLPLTTNPPICVGDRVERIVGTACNAGELAASDRGTVERVDGGRLLVKWDGARRSRIAVDARNTRWRRIPTT